MEQAVDNMQKYENYKEQMGRLKKAMNAQFYLEAIFIEYAIVEDRCTSVLQHSGVFNPKKHRTLTTKLNKIEDMGREKNGLPTKYFSPELIQQIKDWKEKRNKLIHALMNQLLHTEDLKSTAEEGQNLLKLFGNKVSGYNRAIDRRRQKKEV